MCWCLQKAWQGIVQNERGVIVWEHMVRQGTGDSSACFLHHDFTSFCQVYLEGVWKASRGELLLEDLCLSEEATGGQ